MKSYLPKRQLTRGQRGPDKSFLLCFENGLAKLKDVIESIEGTGEDTTLLALETYGETGIPIESVGDMLREIRRDLLEAEHELIKAAETLSGIQAETPSK